ncbi:MAG: hypothetical protein ACIALR_02440 [Blastopirellula sp. JB062]
MNVRRITFSCASLMIVLVLLAVAQACPTCKAGFGERYVNAYGWSIIFMMAMPFTLIGAFATYIYWTMRGKAAVAKTDVDESLADLAQRKTSMGVPTQPPVDA